MAVVNGNSSTEILTGGAEADIIYAYAGDDTLNGLAGNDTLEGGAGADSISGGAGNDIIDGGAGASGGAAEITGSATIGGADYLDGGEGDDTFIITASELTGIESTDNNTADGLNSEATVYDTIMGGAGTDTLEAKLYAGDVIDQSGLSIISGVGVPFFSPGSVIAGLTIRDVEMVKVTNVGDYMLDLSADAAFGSDLALTSADGAAAGSAISALSYTAASGIVSSFITDFSVGLQINGTYYGGTGQDTSFETTNGGTVTVYQGKGEWYLQYTPAADAGYVVGDASTADDDVFDSALTAVVTDSSGNTVSVDIDLSVNYNKDINASKAVEGVTIFGDAQENVITGSAYNDVIWAGATAADEADTIDGGAGDDILGGKGGADSLVGGSGADTIYAGAGADDIDGGAGDDMIWAGDDADVAVTGGSGNDVIGGGAGADSLLGGDGDDVIYAGAGEDNDTLNGESGADTIYAGAGDDSILGGTGDDLLFNGAGADTVAGGAGNDTIWGGAGNDSLTGDAGNDVFAFASGNGADVITDFDITSTTAGEGDVLDLSAFGFADVAAVLDAASAASATSTSIYIEPGHTITLQNVTLTALQGATTDWVIV